jgi:hypothetical protein
MGRGVQCTVCLSPHRAEMERLRQEGLTYPQISVAVEAAGGRRISPNTLANHWANGHVGTEVVAVPAGDADLEDPRIRAAIDAQQSAEAAGYQVKGIRVEARTSQWEAQQKGGTLAELESSRNGVTLNLAPLQGAVPVEIRQATPVEIKLHMSRPPKREKGDLLTAFIVPDEQHPFADPRALDVKNQLLAYVEKTEGVDRIVHNGDGQDLTGLGKHRTAPSQMDTMQQGLEDGYQDLATERAICPEALIDYLEGNHEIRMINLLVDAGIRLVGITRANSPEGADPVLSIPFLLRMDELGVTYHGPWPEGALWLNDSLRVIHGYITGPDAGKKYLAEMECSTISGHGHHAYWLAHTIHRGRGISRTYIAASAGTLCKLDGTTPSAKSGVTAAGKPGKAHGEQWQQAIIVCRYNPAGGEVPDVQLVLIVEGVAHYEGRTFTARCDIDGNPLEVAA